MPERHERLLCAVAVAALPRSQAVAPAAPPVVFADGTTVADRYYHVALGTVDHSCTRTELTVGAHFTADAHPGTHHHVTGSTGAVAHTHVTTCSADPHAAAQHLNAGPVADDVHAAAASGRLGQLRLQLPDRHLERRRVGGRLLRA